MDVTQNGEHTEFVQVDIEEFYESDKSKDEEYSKDIVVLSDAERTLVDKLLNRLKTISPETLEGLEDRISDMKRLASSIAHFPSLLQRKMIMGEIRTQNTLIDALLVHKDGDKMIHLPSKAILGKGFLVAKYHTFSSMTRLAESSGLDKIDIKNFQTLTSEILFTIMFEDVYINLCDDITISQDIRRKIALALIILWEHRHDQKVSDVAPVLKSIWEARKDLAPAFGTMVGTSELLLISIRMDADWAEFLKKRLEDKDVTMALEEFLFGLSYEQIKTLRTILREKGISAIGRDEISSFLGENIKTDITSDLREFYLQYTIRRDNARVRKRLKIEGPHNTLEDHYMRFIMEKNEEKQNNDIYAK